MRRNDKAITDTEAINHILNNSVICRLAFFDQDYPYIVPMNYGYKDNNLYFHCATTGKKLDLIRKNNKVGFEIEASHHIEKHDLSCKWTTKYKSIIGNGSIEIINDPEQIIAALDIIMSQHGKHENQYNPKHLANVSILKLNIHNISAKQSL